MYDLASNICLAKLYVSFCVIVPLGSITELPAKSCTEIKKSSEGEQAASGKYWLDSIIPGEVVLVDCDMETEGKLCF